MEKALERIMTRAAQAGGSDELSPPECLQGSVYSAQLDGSERKTLAIALGQSHRHRVCRGARTNVPAGMDARVMASGTAMTDLVQTIANDCLLRRE